ncbi:hypothetical protein ACVWZD_005368 [Streptomyces sp. TE3672]
MSCSNLLVGVHHEGVTVVFAPDRNNRPALDLTVTELA